MVKVYIDVDMKETHSEEQVKEFIKTGMKYTRINMLRSLIINSPVDKGKLRGWFPAEITDTSVEFRTPANYAIYVEEGTGIYGRNHRKITPKTGKALKFTYKGNTFFRKSVKGQPGQHFVKKSIEQTKGKVEELFLRAQKEVFS